MASVSTSAPSPPYCFGMESVRRPRFEPSRMIDQSKDLDGSGLRSAFSAAGIMKFTAKSRAISRSSRCRGVMAKSTMYVPYPSSSLLFFSVLHGRRPSVGQRTAPQEPFILQVVEQRLHFRKMRALADYRLHVAARHDFHRFDKFCARGVTRARDDALAEDEPQRVEADIALSGTNDDGAARDRQTVD